ncbi:hypothetical protein [Clostridium grantii]|uniref:Uncharacterized protein n=1 Tax=Clostridium grantii DSM 8605 TaxID=1121316 RepID=A0A1M5V7W7_9CLOT|nr:hypothetical protein [Clostridium grantii]SHH71316.1 hypothetical protein SAMN02745207_02156 [Clostridium grantii DSM 8605]
MRLKAHVRCRVGENLEIRSKDYLSLLNTYLMSTSSKIINGLISKDENLFLQPNEFLKPDARGKPSNNTDFIKQTLREKEEMIL